MLGGLNMDQVKCRLCQKEFDISEMSKEHYPARSVGNEDIIALDIAAMGDKFINGEILDRLKRGESVEKIVDDTFEKDLVKKEYPEGRTVLSLCRSCNTFLGKYDKSYLNFFNVDGDPNIVKGFSKQTKLNIIKAIYAKFISIPEAKNEEFDFLKFINDERSEEYLGNWSLYFIKRDLSTDFLGLKDIRTGVLHYDEGIVYQLSDEKFIYNLMNFEKHPSFNMTNIFEILEKKFKMFYGEDSEYRYNDFIMFSLLGTEEED